MTIHIEWSTLGYIALGIVIAGLGALVGVVWTANKMNPWR